MSLDTVPGRLRNKNAHSVPVHTVNGSRGRRTLGLVLAALVCWFSFTWVNAQSPVAQTNAIAEEHPGELPLHTLDVLTPGILLTALLLVFVSGFFSATETAYFSLNRMRLRKMQESGQMLQMLAARHMEHPGKLLASLLMGNMIANILLGVVLAEPSEDYFEKCLMLPPSLSYVLALVSTTMFIVFFAEISPKVSVVRNGEWFATVAALPLAIIDFFIAPLRDGAVFLVGIIFKVTGFSKLPPAPFITDDEFLSVLSEGEATGAIERGEREMIQGILEFSEVMLKEVLVPRPDMIALPEGATVREAVALFRDQEYARMPVYKENLDNIVGVLYAKDLLPYSEEADIDRPILPLLRKVHFVPETMTVQGFVKLAQRLRTHMAIVVDEYGGTEGLITLQDALREVVGDIGDDVEESPPGYTKLHEGTYRIDGSLSLHELEELTGVTFEDEEHTTVAGFLMDKTDKIPGVGERIEHNGVVFTVEKVDGKRVSQLRLQVLDKQAQEAVN